MNISHNGIPCLIVGIISSISHKTGCDLDMTKPNGDCDVSPLLINLKEDIKFINARIQNVLENFDDQSHCLLGDFQSIQETFMDIQYRAATFYLDCYLSPFTNKYSDLANCVRNLSMRRHGALIAVERKDPLDPFVHNGSPIMAEVSPVLLESIFYPGNPLHDGAVLIRSDKIISAKNVLPLSSTAKMETKLGTRHRAAVGLSERTDAIVLVVSEETGKVSFSNKGRLYPVMMP